MPRSHSVGHIALQGPILFIIYINDLLDLLQQVVDICLLMTHNYTSTLLVKMTDIFCWQY